MAGAKKGHRERSRATRNSIIAAAHIEFEEHGFHGATITAIAERAGVAPQTIYFTFNNKANLISAVIDAAVIGPDDSVPPQQQVWWMEMLDEPDPQRALRLFIRGAGPAFARASTISEVLAAAARTDDEVRETHRHHERLRREAFGEVLEMLAGKGSLRSELAFDRLLDVFLVVYGDGTYHLLSSMGWTHEQIMDWLCDNLPSLLLAPT